jgi:hypothetical protein
MRCYVLKSGLDTDPDPELLFSSSSDNELNAVSGVPLLFVSTELSGISFGVPISVSANISSQSVSDITIIAKYGIDA